MKSHVGYINNSTIYTLFYIICLGQIVLQTYVPVLQFWDETLTVLFLLLIISRLLKDRKSINIHYYYMLALIVILAIIGLYGNLRYKIQTSPAPILNDLGNCFKVYIAYIGSCLYFSNVKIGHITMIRTIRKSANFTRVLILIMFVFAVINLFVDIGMRQEYRFGIPTFQFIIGGSGNFSNFFFPIMLILTMDYYCCRNRKNRQIFIITALLVWASALRVRGLVHIFMYIVICYYVIHLKKQKFNIFIVLFCLSIIYFIAINQVHYYLDEGTTARYNLLFWGYETAVNCFPIGAGFSTYGTDAAAKYYSPLYEQYGFENVWGLSSDNPEFAHDNYWPAIMGEFGFVGIVFTILLVYLLMKDFFRLAGETNYMKALAYFASFVLLFQSTGSPVFFHYITVCIMIILSFLFSCNIKTKKNTLAEWHGR